MAFQLAEPQPPDQPGDPYRVDGKGINGSDLYLDEVFFIQLPFFARHGQEGKKKEGIWVAGLHFSGVFGFVGLK
ncbi:MAG: hypothetical protein H6558_01965 [Lewinellaceae bacterium]|nr:hypothetical protein [Lewinellaceae bacterium]MCB9286818.1 hypothetical protein [Lewinellaceae bacterium]